MMRARLSCALSVGFIMTRVQQKANNQTLDKNGGGGEGKKTNKTNK